MRKSNWKQDSPRMQIATLLQSVHGHLDNMKLQHGSSKSPDRLAKMCQDLSDAQEILRSEFSDTDWKS